MSETTSGKNLNLTLERGKETRIAVKIWRGDSELSLSGITVVGKIRDIVSGEDVDDIDYNWTSELGLVLIFPSVATGRYVFVVDMVNDAGTSSRLIDGYVTYELQESVPVFDASLVETRLLNVVIDGEKARIAWGKTSVVEKVAAEAKESADTAAALLEQAEKDTEELRTAADALNEGITTAFTIGANENWYIGGIDTGKPSRGREGEAGADGKDGINARDYVFRTITDESNLPTPSAEYVGTSYIVVDSEGGTQKVFVLCGKGTTAEPYSWQDVGYIGQLASSSVYGYVKYGTDSTISVGFPVGKNASGQMVVDIPEATESIEGLVRLGTAHIQKNAATYLQSVGADSSNKLCFNLQNNGPLQNIWDGYKYELGVARDKDVLPLNSSNALTVRAAVADGESGIVKVVTDITKTGDVVPTAATVKTALDAKADESSIEVQVNNAVKDAIKKLAGEPVGTIHLYAGPCEEQDATGEWVSLPAPDGYLWCSGQALNRNTYADLFAVLSTTYAKTGDSDDIFRVPDMRDRFVRGYPRNIEDPDGERLLGNMQACAAPNIKAHWVIDPFSCGIQVNTDNGMYRWRGTNDNYKNYTTFKDVDPSGWGVAMAPDGAVSLNYRRIPITDNGTQYNTNYYWNNNASTDKVNSGNFSLVRCYFNAANCNDNTANVYQDGVKSVYPKNIILNYIIKY